MAVDSYKKDNNIFEYATKETTQDSFFSWIINWFNYKEKEKYYNFSKAFLNQIVPDGLKKEIDNIYNIKIVRQIFDIDILLILNMKNGEQKFLIIENKTNTGLGDQQQKTAIYYTKFIYRLVHCVENKNDKDLFKKLKINIEVEKEKTKKHVFATLIRTNVSKEFNDKDDIVKALSNLNRNEDYNKYYKEIKEYTENKHFWDNHFKFINSGNELEKLVRVLKDNKFLDTLIEDYYNHITFSLENNGLLHDDNSTKEKTELIENETHFRITDLCFSYFNNLGIKRNPRKKYKGKLEKINIQNIIEDFYNKDRSEVWVQCLNFVNGNDFDNTFIGEDIWQEKQNIKNKIRYVFLFAKDTGVFSRDEYYTFKGLFKFLKKTDEYTYWIKCKINDTGIISIKKEDIENYIKEMEEKYKDFNDC